MMELRLIPWYTGWRGIIEWGVLAKPMPRIKMDKSGVLHLPRETMELLDIEAGDCLKLLVVGKELHIHKCKLKLCAKNSSVISDFEVPMVNRH